MTINKERVELFLAALESGDYRQCKARLRDRHLFNDLEVHCALGVATDVALKNGLQANESVWNTSLLDERVSTWYGFSDDEFEDNDPIILVNDELGESVSVLNDAGWSFWDIAQAGRAHWLKDQGERS